MIEKIENIKISDELERTPNISDIVIKVNEIIDAMVDIEKKIEKLEEILK